MDNEKIKSKAIIPKVITKYLVFFGLFQLDKMNTTIIEMRPMKNVNVPTILGYNKSFKFGGTGAPFVVAIKIFVDANIEIKKDNVEMVTVL